jgi:predicted DNA-binding protein (MmcQ/YjbR family)
VAKARRAKKSSPARSGGANRRRTTTLRTFIESKPGATATVFAMAGGKTPVALIHKIKGRMFAIQSLRGDEYVILKCDPNLVPVLRHQYAGVGHRSHLDKRFWIAVDLNADVPTRELRKLVDHSYGLVRTGLTRKQQAELAAGA